MPKLVSIPGPGETNRLAKLLQNSSEEVAVLEPRPREYSTSFLVGRPLPYRCCDVLLRENGVGGVLAVGEIVWLRAPLSQADRRRQIIGWTQRTGRVLIVARDLVPLQYHPVQASPQAA